MAREPWKCPHAGCKRECGREWNMKRHIMRRHNGEGVPVKNKSSADTEKLACDTQHTDNIEGLYPRNKIAKEENNKKGQGVKTTGELDPIDRAYQIFKPLKDRNDKMEEMITYFAKNSRIPFPSHLHPDIFNYHPNTTFDPPVGFRTYICENCLTGPIDPVKLSDFETLGPLAFRPRHTCKQEDLENLRCRTTNKQYIDVITTWDELRKLSLQRLADIIYQIVGPHKDIHMKVIEDSDSNSQIADSSPINLGKIDEKHWAYRVLIAQESKGTKIDNTELINFLNLAKSTFAPFQAEIYGIVRYFYLYIPILMFQFPNFLPGIV
jgi:hypothetical protein